MTDPIDAEDTVALIDELVEQYGRDHRAPCYYIDAGSNEKICLVGKIFTQVGISDSRLRRFGRKPPVTLWEESMLPEFTERAAVILHRAQFAQDMAGGTWGQAKDVAHMLLRDQASV